MQITTTEQPAAPTLPKCFAEGCVNRIHPDVAVYIHVADEPDEGPITVNMVLSGAHFCSSACRVAWWDTATQELLCPPFSTSAPLAVTVFHVDPSTWRQMNRCTDRDGRTILDQKGAPVAHHRFDTADQLEAWWRCEAEAEVLALPLVGES